MRVSHVHCRVRDLQAAARWFEQGVAGSPRGSQRADGLAGLRRVWRNSGRRLLIAWLHSASTVRIATQTIVLSRAAVRKRSRHRKIGRGAHAPPTLRDQAG